MHASLLAVNMKLKVKIKS